MNSVAVVFWFATERQGCGAARHSQCVCLCYEFAAIIEFKFMTGTIFIWYSSFERKICETGCPSTACIPKTHAHNAHIRESISTLTITISKASIFYFIDVWSGIVSLKILPYILRIHYMYAQPPPSFYHNAFVWFSSIRNLRIHNFRNILWAPILVGDCIKQAVNACIIL